VAVAPPLKPAAAAARPAAAAKPLVECEAGAGDCAQQ
jgi:hypothetical protein